MNNKIYYKLVCIDQQHALLAEMQLGQHDKIKAKCLGRAVVVSIDNSAGSTEPLTGSIDTSNTEPKELAEINYMLSSVRVHAMAYDEELSQYDVEAVDSVKN